MGGDLLHKGEVGAMGLKERSQAGEVGHMVCVEGEEGKERPLGLTIVSVSCRRHLD
jgi:predicted transcriptional regulator YdeE